ncbi:Ig-like domain-containing protein [Deinococcus cellulosilyticus]|uniref:SbsA Ig-like domain-containing protein n=1 Tax=Deinococcus cellulosilyticus (strain DSM 18568 / NBRC 106333 / KACC 11606 / 5516J-15) TaxID=1223518 RepID=A0A511N7T5_DEIC1|nr:Ig-like domain-containing protein [Deinococcus cellulosilyticus]GEM48548.1 hypothetical protein DC3_41830 [Deinococcus cellulosilyticus NBRC 106333 = KACC 11606]
MKHFLMLSALLGLLSACSMGSPTPPPPAINEPGPPEAWIYPHNLHAFNGVDHLDLDEDPILDFNVLFNEEMDKNSVVSSVSITDDAGHLVPFDFTLTSARIDGEGPYALLIPMVLNARSKAPLKYGTHYTIAVKRTARDITGENLKEEVSADLWTAVAPYRLKVEQLALAAGDPPVLQVKVTNLAAPVKSLMLHASCARNVVTTSFYRYFAALDSGESRQVNMTYSSGKQDVAPDLQCAVQGEVLDQFARVYIE